MTVEELITELQSYDDDLEVVTALYEIDHTVFYGPVHTIRFDEAGKNAGMIHKDRLILDAGA